MENLHDNREFREWIDRNILANVTELMSELYSDDRHIDDLLDSCQNYYWCHECECSSESCTNSNHEHEPQESLEYYLVDERLWRHLRDIGETVYDYLGLKVWGRTCTGQHISLDYPLQQIYERLL